MYTVRWRRGFAQSRSCSKAPLRQLLLMRRREIRKAVACDLKAFSCEVEFGSGALPGPIIAEPPEARLSIAQHPAGPEHARASSARPAWSAPPRPHQAVLRSR